MDKNTQDQLIKSIMYELEEYAIVMLDKEGYIQSWNLAAKKIKGYSEEEIIGKNFRIFYTEYDRKEGKPDKLMKTAIKEGRAIDKGWRLHKDGTRFWGSIVITTIHNDNGEIIGFTKITQDLTKQKKIEDKFRNIIEGAPDSMLLIDCKGRIQIVNQEIENTFGYNRKELLNQHVEILLPERYREKHSVFRNNYMSKPYKRPMGSGLDLFGLRKNGEEFPVEISISQLTEDEENIQIIATIRDITEKKSLLNEIIEAKEKAEESDRLKSAFLATMSHELRTPLNHIIGFGDVITDIIHDKQILELVELIKDSGVNLLKIIEDIMSLASLENKNIKLRSESMSISEFYIGIKNLANRILSESGKKGLIDLNYKVNDNGLLLKMIVTDRYKVYQALTNLINNAVKYTDKGFITIGLFQPDEKSIAISIQDTGIGISSEKQEAIFEYFRQGDDSLSREFGGIGAGLTIAERIADFIGGKITLNSEEGKGSEFTFILPIDINKNEY